MESRSLNEVPGGGEHGDATVLELGGTEPEEGLLGTEGGEVEGVEALEGGCGRGGGGGRGESRRERGGC